MITIQEKLETLKRMQKRAELDKYELELKLKIKHALGEYDIMVEYEEEIAKQQSILDVLNEEISIIESEA